MSGVLPGKCTSASSLFVHYIVRLLHWNNFGLGILDLYLPQSTAWRFFFASFAEPSRAHVMHLKSRLVCIHNKCYAQDICCHLYTYMYWYNLIYLYRSMAVCVHICCVCMYIYIRDPPFVALLKQGRNVSISSWDAIGPIGIVSGCLPQTIFVDKELYHASNLGNLGGLIFRQAQPANKGWKKLILKETHREES